MNMSEISSGWRELCLISEGWQVTFSHPVSGAKHTIATTVPGNFAKDLARAGLLKEEEIMHPATSAAIREFEKVPEWVCTTVFDRPELSKTARQFLVFHGVDTIADVRLNGELIGECRNMFIRYEFDVTDKLLPSGNLLEVRIIDPVRHAETMELDALAYWTSLDSFTSYIRRARCLMSWDNAPRLLTGGLWRNVALCEKENYRFEDCYIYTRNLSEDLSSASIGVHFFAEFPEELRCRLTGKVIFSYQGKTVHEEVVPLNRHYYTLHNITINSPELWWPRGYGKADLYDIAFEMYDGETLLCRKTERFGIRFVLFEFTETISPDGTGEFAFYCNHQRIYCRGTNWKPIDGIFSDITSLRIRQALDLAVECNCNMVRVWGGGIYEEKAFFDYCDENGLMVWQDFMMACEFPLQSEENQKIMAEEAKAVIKELRNHPCIFLWCGDNEVDKGVFRPVRFPDAVVPSDNIITRVTLPQTVKRFDPFRFYLPSTPYVSDELARNRKQDYQLFAPVLHLYMDYTVFHDSLRRYPARFIAETGPIGFSAFSETKAITDLEQERMRRLWDAAPSGPNPPGMGHQADCYFAGCLARMRQALQYELGRDFTPDDFEEFVPAVNFICAEIFKDAIEYYRMCKPVRTGVLWWSLLDMFPMMFNYSVVDYAMRKKLPFYWITRSQQTLCFMMDADENGLKLKCANDSLQEFRALSCRVYRCDLETGAKELLWDLRADVPANSAVTAAENLQSTHNGLFLMEWEENGEYRCNHFIRQARPRTLTFISKVCEQLKNYYKF